MCDFETGLRRRLLHDRERVVVACVLLAGLASCGDNAVAGARDGTRLALRRYVYGEGTVQLDRGWYVDLARGEPCTAQRWTDGERHCTPALAETTFADSQCLTRVARVPPSAGLRYGVVRGIDGYVSRVYSLGERFGGASALSWKLEDGQCVGPFAGDGAAELFQLREAESSDAFASLHRTTATRDARLQVVYETSDDGMRAPVAFYDTELSLECDAVPSFDAETTQCAPTSSVAAAYFGDAACTVPAAAISTIRMPDAIESELGGCPEYWAVGQEVFRLWSAAGCREVALPAGARFFAATTVLDTASVARTRRYGPRISLVGLDDHEPQITDAFVHDADLRADCTPIRRADGLRCMPPARAHLATVDRYALDDCRMPLAVAYTPGAGCESSPSFGSDDDGALRHLAPLYVEPLYEQSGSGACALATPPPGTEPHVVGDRISDTSFVPVAVEPEL
jgi:hypothetical protein